MAGHSKWAQIKHAKAITDARRGKLFTKLAKEIIVVAREGGGDPDANFRLRMAIQRAKDANMPADTIARAVNRGAGGGGEGDNVSEVRYEGYGPGGTAIRKRTVSAVRSTFTKAGGSMAEVGSVAWQFDQRGVVVVEADGESIEDIAIAAIDAGADDFEADESTIEIHSPIEALETIRRSMSECDAVIVSSQLAMLPKNLVTLDESTAKRTLRLLDQLEELDDVQRVYSNGDFPEGVLADYGAES